MTTPNDQPEAQPQEARPQPADAKQADSASRQGADLDAVIRETRPDVIKYNEQDEPRRHIRSK